MGALPSMSRFGDEMKPVFRAMAWKPVDLELELGINSLIRTSAAWGWSEGIVEMCEWG